MEPLQQKHGAGLGFLGVAAALFILATAGGQPAFLGLGVAFLVMGLGARYRHGRKTPR
jgi:hypothetical protein